MEWVSFAEFIEVRDEDEVFIFFYDRIIFRDELCGCLLSLF